MAKKAAKKVAAKKTAAKKTTSTAKKRPSAPAVEKVVKAAEPAPAPTVRRNLLAEGVDAVNAGGAAFAPLEDLEHLLFDPRGPLVEYNTELRGEDGVSVAFRATALGVQVLTSGAYTPPAPPAPAAAPWPSAPAASADADEEAEEEDEEEDATEDASSAGASWAMNQAGKTNDPLVRTSRQRTAAGIAYADDVPIPPMTRGGRGASIYGFETMPVGKSFFVPASADNPTPAKRLTSTAASAGRRLGRVFVVRTVADGKPWGMPGVSGAACWRKE